MYNGEVQIYQHDLDRFLLVAQRLRLQGLLSDPLNEETVEEKFHEENIKSEQVQSSKIAEFKEMRVTEVDYREAIVPVSINQQELDDVNEKVNEYMEKCSDGSYKCKICGKIPTGKNSGKTQNMRNHIETHMEGLSFPCPICQRTFRSRNSLSSHKSQTHK